MTVFKRKEGLSMSTMVSTLGGGKKLLLLALVVAATFAVSAATASADYGRGAVYQIELSVNSSGSQGGGIWLWIGLNADGTGDYAGSDCRHRRLRQPGDYVDREGNSI